MCLNTEKVMNMFSKELSQLDKNTVQYMIDEMQTEIDGMKHESPQCGFASCEIGNKLTEDEQWAKLKLVKEIVEEVWG